LLRVAELASSAEKGLLDEARIEIRHGLREQVEIYLGRVRIIGGTMTKHHMGHFVTQRYAAPQVR